MPNEQPDPQDLFTTLATMEAHRIHVRSALLLVVQEIERRAARHDVSKYGPDELSGFARINRASREHPYGSLEYRAALKQEKPTIQIHYDRNDHHPEHWDHPDHNIGPGMMPVFALIEMVCDWWAAWKTYEAHRAPELRASWRDNMEKQRERFAGTFAPWQWHVIGQVAELLAQE
jgi:hypothetical protein